MLRRKLRKSDNHPSSESFSYSRVESSTRSDSPQNRDAQNDNVLSNSVDIDEKPAVSWSAEEKKIFEDQLESLQDQLIATMMENQKLGLCILVFHT